MRPKPPNEQFGGMLRLTVPCLSQLLSIEQTRQQPSTCNTIEESRNYLDLLTSRLGHSAVNLT